MLQRYYFYAYERKKNISFCAKDSFLRNKSDRFPLFIPNYI